MKSFLLIVVLCLTLSYCSTSQRSNHSTPRAVETADAMMFEIPWSFQGDEGTRFVSDVWDIRTTMKYQNILDSLLKINEMSEDIDRQTSAQRHTVTTVTEDIKAIAQIADDILANAAKNADAFKELNGLVEKQSQSVSLFRLE